MALLKESLLKTTFKFKVARQSGARGTVGIPFTTEEGTAKAGKDYEHVEGELLFNNEENSCPNLLDSQFALLLFAAVVKVS